MLKDVRVKDVMDTTFETVEGSISVQELMENYILKKRERTFLVTEAGNLAGIVCLDDVKDVPAEKRQDTTVKDIMTPSDRLETVSGSDTSGDILAKLASGKINQVPVIKAGEIKGIVCRSNILDFLHLRTELGV
jgi:predicted transcriptional regulator